jgi:hypothetical protein
MCLRKSDLLGHWLSIGALLTITFLGGCAADSRSTGAMPGDTPPADGTHEQDSQIVRDAVAASKWIARALNSSGYKADFSMESLREIDRFFDEHSADGKPKPGGLLAEQTGARLFAIGAYVGEVLRRHLDGTWYGDDTDPRAEINIEVHFGPDAKIWPIQKTMKRLVNGAEDSLYPYARVIESYVKKEIIRHESTVIGVGFDMRWRPLNDVL